MIKSDKIKSYNELYNYHITNIKKITRDQFNDMRNNAKCCDLYYLYKKPSQAKIYSWNNILSDYKPIEIISVQGSCMTYGVWLIAENGSLLHITKCNNYLVEVL